MDDRPRIHKFEESGLGKGPYEFLFVASIPSKALSEANPQAYSAALADLPRTTIGGCGTCSYCGMPLTDNYIIRSADDQTFPVGCECVKKVGDRGLILKVERVVKEKRRQTRIAREQVLADEYDHLIQLPGVVATLSAKPHPNAYFAAQGKTALDYRHYVVSSNSAKARDIKWLRQYAAEHTVAA